MAGVLAGIAPDNSVIWIKRIGYHPNRCEEKIIGSMPDTQNIVARPIFESFWFKLLKISPDPSIYDSNQRDMLVDFQILKIVYETTTVIETEPKIHHTWSWILKTHFYRDARMYKLTAIRIISDNTFVRPEFPEENMLDDMLDLEQGNPSNVDTLLTSPQYRLEIVYQEEGGRQLLRKMALINGCPGKTYDDELEKEIVSSAEVALIMNAMVLENESLLQ